MNIESIRVQDMLFITEPDYMVVVMPELAIEFIVVNQDNDGNNIVIHAYAGKHLWGTKDSQRVFELEKMDALKIRDFIAQTIALYVKRYYFKDRNSDALKIHVSWKSKGRFCFNKVCFTVDNTVDSTNKFQSELGETVILDVVSRFLNLYLP